jgi:DNA-binding FrmR family transcriptional regulator
MIERKVRNLTMSTNKHHDVENLCQRINKVEGQLGGIRKMLENDKPCDEIIIQLNSAKAALQKISQIILEDHLDHCVLEALRDGNREAQVDSLKRALSQYTKMV